MTPIKYYQQKQQKNNTRLKELKKKVTTNSILRLLSFIAVPASLFGLIRLVPVVAYFGALLFLIIFLVLVRRHIQLQKQFRYEKELDKILLAEMNACNHNFTDFRSGDRFQNHHHSYSFDLDFFGKGSVFPMLNRTVTKYGEDLLADMMLQETVEKIQVEKNQEAVRELADNPEFMLHFRTTGNISDLEEEDWTKIKNWVSKKSFLRNGILQKVLRVGLPVLTLFSLILMIINPASNALFILLFLFNLGYVSFNLRNISKEHNQVSNLLKLLQKYTDLIHVIESQKFHSDLLAGALRKLKYQNTSAGESLQKLTKLVSMFDNRLNFVAAIFLEGILLWDYNCLNAINIWRKKYGSRLDEWLKEIAFIDAYISLSGYAFNEAGFVYPKVSDKVILEAKNLGHPSIPSSVRVCNDFNINKKGEFVIITGANMAGKSTFLRTVGVNLILARLGVPVCATEFIFKPVRLFTSMRTSDSLADNESYFYAELRRLQEMLLELEKEGDIFIILDEILKGTNSVDKQKGSFAAMEKIIRLGGTGIIATHDLALTEISKDHSEIIRNMCFEIEIDNANIQFDYKLYDGVTQKMNAMLLMEQMGII
jgi:DNA mismatch repair ATPase MutS